MCSKYGHKKKINLCSGFCMWTSYQMKQLIKLEYVLLYKHLKNVVLFVLEFCKGLSWLHLFQSYFNGIKFQFLGEAQQRNNEKIPKIIKYWLIVQLIGHNLQKSLKWHDENKDKTYNMGQVTAFTDSSLGETKASSLKAELHLIKKDNSYVCVLTCTSNWAE